MATAVGDLVIRILGDKAHAAKTFDSVAVDAKKMAMGVKSHLSTIGTVLGIGLGASTIAMGLKHAIDAARALSREEKKLDAVLAATGYAAGLAGTEIKEMAKALSDVSSFDVVTLMRGAAVLATFKEVKGTVFKEAMSAAMDLSEVMGQDVQASVVQLGKALQSPTEGLTALKRVGVSFNDEQRKQIKLLEESGQRVEAQKLILAELKSEFGGAAEAMASPMKQVDNAVNEVYESVGMRLLPYVKQVATSMRDGARAAAEYADALGDIPESKTVVGAFADTLATLKPIGKSITAMLAWPGLDKETRTKAIEDLRKDWAARLPSEEAQYWKGEQALRRRNAEAKAALRATKDAARARDEEIFGTSPAWVAVEENRLEEFAGRVDQAGSLFSSMTAAIDLARGSLAGLTAEEVKIRELWESGVELDEISDLIELADQHRHVADAVKEAARAKAHLEAIRPKTEKELMERLEEDIVRRKAQLTTPRMEFERLFGKEPAAKGDTDKLKAEGLLKQWEAMQPVKPVEIPHSLFAEAATGARAYSAILEAVGAGQRQQYEQEALRAAQLTAANTQRLADAAEAEGPGLDI